MIPATRNIGAGATTLSTTDNILNIDTTLGAAIINLPSVATWFELKNKSGSIYDADGLRYTDVGGLAGTNSITFVAADGEFVNGAASIVINTNGASGVITPTLDAAGSGINGWEASLVGSASGAGSYNVFGAVIIDDIYVESVDLAGLENVYAPQNGESQGEAIHIGGDGVIVTSVSMPDLIKVYGGIIVSENNLLTSFLAPQLTLVTDYLVLGGSSANPQLAFIDLSAIVEVKDLLAVQNSVATTLNLLTLTIAGGIAVTNNILLTSITIGTALNCTDFDFEGNALSESNVDSILANIDVAGFSRVAIAYDTLVGTFQIGETITGGTSGATTVITSDRGSEMEGNTVLGIFQTGETITGGTSGATANTIGFAGAPLNLTGGTNSAPSAAGLVSKSNLQAKGWNVQTN